jgi:hypothetical protein
MATTNGEPGFDLGKAGFRGIVTHRLAHDVQNNWYVVTK